jgi:hypothetical protein
MSFNPVTNLLLIKSVARVGNHVYLRVSKKLT